MRIRAFFLLSLSAAAAVGLFSAVVTVATEWQHANAAAQAQQLVMAVRAGVSATERLAFERGYYLLDIFIEPAIDNAPAKIKVAEIAHLASRLPRASVPPSIRFTRGCWRCPPKSIASSIPSRMR